ncbi:DNA topoisomerase 1 alpha isoform X1 [Amborella trichopoda]|uniref:DNA topoisomerase 1 alpha isoform X1 n=2 Tax=Amborella trichopoda TaxID=13333 RepID=UPI0005D2E791|nr:DNA topoisomerase 1 alpha isoform X1 [Amborella trichopoda]|eukprot:XP_011627735.1 DNA topoisomerase 1 alpha isoform X1 [Amborella trichopoda]
MAGDNSLKQEEIENSDDDDEFPLVFKRYSTPAKPKQSVAVPKKSSQGNSEPLGRPSSVDRGAPKNISLVKPSHPNVQRDNTLPSLKSALFSSAISTAKSGESRDMNPGINDKDSQPLQRPSSEPNMKSEDSDDDKPLNSRVAAVANTVKNKSPGPNLPLSCSAMPVKTIVKSPVNVVKRSPDDSDDEKPLSQKFPRKSSNGAVAGTSIKPTYDDSDEEKPLASNFQRNGSSKKNLNGELPLKVNQILKKRPAEESKVLAKKPKPSADPSSSSRVKVEVTVKAEKSERGDDEDDLSISQRMKKFSSVSGQASAKKIKTKVVSSSFKKTGKNSKKEMKKIKGSKSAKGPPGSGDGQKWSTLEHNGVIFPSPYKPHGVKMLYNGQPVDLTPEKEEVATMFAVMKDTEYETKPKFIDNFMNDWRVILGKNHVIKKFELCDFTPIYEWHLKEKEKKKQMSAEEKKALKEEKAKLEEKYMWAIVDGVKEKVGNFRVEPPGLFRGRGEHPKMGKLKRRIFPKDITINIGKNAPIPECPISGQRWKEIKHDNTVTWLAFWNDPINPKELKYVFLAASSSLKGQSDKEKYEKARLLKDYIDSIRETYTKHFNSKDIMKRQTAIATYLIDRLALRAGNEKDDDEADTVGCCTLKVENVTLLPLSSLQFDFLGKDSIRYFNTVEVLPPVYKAIGDFRSGKKEGDDLFDKLDTSKLNAHLKELMPGLTAKVFRTYNASETLDRLLQDTTGSNPTEKIADYQRANKEVAILCNHQRSVSKSHSTHMEKLGEKMAELEKVLKELQIDLSRAKKGKPPLKAADGKPKKKQSPETLDKKITQTYDKIEKMKLNMAIKEDLKTVALGTSKINYLDPRISVAWCKHHEVPIEKIFNKSLLAKFAWAMDVDLDYRF